MRLEGFTSFNKNVVNGGGINTLVYGGRLWRPGLIKFTHALGLKIFI